MQDKNSKIRIAILFGGRSAEHEISLLSAKNVYDAIDKDKYDITLIGIDKSGKWISGNINQLLLNADDAAKISLAGTEREVALKVGSRGELMDLKNPGEKYKLDIIFPILHGPYGEDGTVQGLLKLANIPFVGAGVLGSSVGMDKDVMKRLLKEAGIPIGKYLSYHIDDNIPDLNVIAEELGFPCYVKPANLGSSVGISRAKDIPSLKEAIEIAFEYDLKIVIEENIVGREIECAVLGNRNPIASGLGEIAAKHDFYSYEAKYLDEKGADLIIPAEIETDVAEKIREMAVDTFRTLNCEGLARVDFFLKDDNTILVNEINTIPGFTAISMYPMLWKQSGISYKDLINRLVELGFERFRKEQKLKTNR